MVGPTEQNPHALRSPPGRVGFAEGSSGQVQVLQVSSLMQSHLKFEGVPAALWDLEEADSRQASSYGMGLCASAPQVSRSMVPCLVSLLG